MTAGKTGNRAALHNNDVGINSSTDAVLEQLEVISAAFLRGVNGEMDLMFNRNKPKLNLITSKD